MLVPDHLRIRTTPSSLPWPSLVEGNAARANQARSVQMPRTIERVSELERLRELTVPTTVEQLQRLRARISTHVDLIDEQRYDNEFLDAELARDIASSLLAMVDAASHLGADERALVRGAVDYFVLTLDADNDVTSPFGLEDDARVVNHVCERIGRPDLAVTTT
jgi:hypothetical protein